MEKVEHPTIADGMEPRIPVSLTHVQYMYTHTLVWALSITPLKRRTEKEVNGLARWQAGCKIFGEIIRAETNPDFIESES